MDSKTVKELIGVIKGTEKQTTPYDTIAEVTRIEGSTAWVHIPGGVDETPVAMTVNAKEGDTVRVRVSGGQAWLTGSDTAPPTDDRMANIAQATAENAGHVAEQALEDAETAATAAAEATESAATAADAAASAQSSAEIAHDAADAAQASANNANEYASRALGNLSTVQSVAETLTWITQHGTMTLTTDTQLDPTHVYFVADTNGDYVVGSTHYSIVAEPDASDLSTYYVLSIDESLSNYVGTHLALTAEGLWVLPDSSGYKVLIATGSGSTYTQAGTYIVDGSGNTVAVFGETSQIGESGKTRIEMDYRSLRLVDKNNNAYFYVSDLRDASGYTTITEKLVQQYSSNKNFICSCNISSVNKVTVNNVEIPSTDYTVPNIGTVTLNTAPAVGSVISIKYTTADARAKAYTCGVRSQNGDMGISSFATGYSVVASGSYSHTEGHDTVASGKASHAEGTGTEATGEESHAEGINSVASGATSHAEGVDSQATGNFSHAENYLTTASGTISHAEGKETTAEGAYSHAEGDHTLALGFWSHAQNNYTIADGNSQTAIGKYNVSDTSNALIIGNGTADNARSNALTVGWDGNVCVALDTSAASGTDHDLYAAITALSWGSEVIV